jgi:hypothetical protein
MLRENGNSDLLGMGFSPSNTDGDSVIDSSDTGGGPGDSFRLLAFGPGPHRAFEDHLALMRFDGDPIRIDFRAAAKRLLYLPLDLTGRDARFELYGVANAL